MTGAALAPALGPLLRRLRTALEAAGKPGAALEARIIVEHATGTSRADALLDPDRQVPQDRVRAALSMLERRLAGEPVYRIVGQRGFYGLRLKLSPGTLEPRPDTEALVDLVLPLVRAAADAHGRCRILDLGTGTGAIALALLKGEPRARAVATDISADALATARANADLNGCAGRFEAVESDWYAGVEGRFHLIVSNPPYISTQTMAALEPEVRDFDPAAALDGGLDGLNAYRAIAQDAARHLEEGAAVAVEIGYDQSEAVPAIFSGHGFAFAGSMHDLAGTVRALSFRP